jgi:hypothetical protein
MWPLQPRKGCLLDLRVSRLLEQLGDKVQDADGDGDLFAGKVGVNEEMNLNISDFLRISRNKWRTAASIFLGPKKIFEKYSEPLAGDCRLIVRGTIRHRSDGYLSDV